MKLREKETRRRFRLVNIALIRAFKFYCDGRPAASLVHLSMVREELDRLELRLKTERGSRR